MGHKIFFVSFRETEERLYGDAINYREINAYFDRSRPKDKLIKSLWFTLLSPFLIRRLHQKEKIDLVYCDDSLPFYAFLIKKIVKIKTIMRLGDLQSAYIFAGNNLLKQMIFKMIFHIERMMWKSVDKVIVISQAFKYFLTTNGIPQSKIDNVQECIDLEMFKPKVLNGAIRNIYGIGADVPLIMFHGLVAKMKGLDTLLNSIPMVLNEKPDAKFMIIGDGGDLKRLKNLVKKLGIEGSVIFTGWVPFNNIPDYLSECDIGIPSRSGNFGNNLVVTTALLQYWAMEKPVIAPRLTAINNFFTKEQAGMTFEPDNANDLAKRIIEMLGADKEVKNRFGITGRYIAKRNFDIEVVSQKMVQILTQ